MALRFDATTETVNHGSGASIDGFVAWTMAVWIRPITVAAAFYPLFSKIASGSGKNFGRGGADLTAYTSRATAYDERISTNVLTVGIWSFVASTYDTTAQHHIYHGTLVSPLVETAYATTDQGGSGAPTSDAAQNLLIGDDGVPNACQTEMAWPMYFDRGLTLAELKVLKDEPWLAPIISGCRLVSEYRGNGGLEMDLSGFANHGTVTGATAVPDFPIIRRRQRNVWFVPSATGGTVLAITVSDLAGISDLRMSPG